MISSAVLWGVSIATIFSFFLAILLGKYLERMRMKKFLTSQELIPASKFTVAVENGYIEVNEKFGKELGKLFEFQEGDFFLEEIKPKLFSKN